MELADKGSKRPQMTRLAWSGKHQHTLEVELDHSPNIEYHVLCSPYNAIPFAGKSVMYDAEVMFSHCHFRDSVNED